MTGWTDQTGVSEIVTLSILQGFGFGLVFVPLSTVAFLTLPNHLRTDGTAMLTLLRNVASSIGISVVIAQLTEGSRRVYAVLDEHVTPFNHAMQMPDVHSIINMGTDAGRALADVMLTLQAQIIAFSHDYQLVMVVTLCAIPLTLMIGPNTDGHVLPDNPDHLFAAGREHPVPLIVGNTHDEMAIMLMATPMPADEAAYLKKLGDDFGAQAGLLAKAYPVPNPRQMRHTVIQLSSDLSFVSESRFIARAPRAGS